MYVHKGYGTAYVRMYVHVFILESLAFGIVLSFWASLAIRHRSVLWYLPSQTTFQVNQLASIL